MNKEITLKITDRDKNLHNIKVKIKKNLNLMEVLKKNELPVAGICGGITNCGTCHCYILSQHKLPNKEEDEEGMLAELSETKENSRLSCQILVENETIDKLEIALAPEE